MPREITAPRHQPVTLTPKKAERILAHIREGQYPGTAALLEGIPKRTWQQWLAWGAEELAEDLAPHAGTLAALVEGVDTARAEAKAEHVRVVVKAAKDGAWQASMTWLERNFPDEYSRNQQIAVEISSPLPVNITAQLSPDTLAAGFLAAARELSAEEMPLLMPGEVVAEVP